jgi:hypothetical protein
VSGPAWEGTDAGGAWCQHKGRRLELPVEAALAFVVEARKKYPDHHYEPRELPRSELAPHRMHLLRAAIRSAGRLPS